MGKKRGSPDRKESATSGEFTDLLEGGGIRGATICLGESYRSERGEKIKEKLFARPFEGGELA